MNMRVFVSSVAVLLALLLGDSNAALGQQPSNPALAQEHKEDGKDIVALINESRVITQKEIDDAIGPQLYALQEKVYNLRKKALENLVTRVLLSDEATQLQLHMNG